MKQVIVNPENCVGCMQCMLACATAHSVSKTLFAATLENPRPRSRIHVAAGRFNQGFPNRCRHCDPAPCQSACLTGAISKNPNTGTTRINPDKCINCASCAMACPYGVLRFHEDPMAPPGKVVAVKCDNCDARRMDGQIPACVEVCKTGALVYTELNDAMEAKNRSVAYAMTDGGQTEPPATVALHKTLKRAAVDVS